MDNMVNKTIRMKGKVILGSVIVVLCFAFAFKLVFKDVIIDKAEIKKNSTKLIEAIIAENMDETIICLNDDVRIYYLNIKDELELVYDFIEGNVVYCEYKGITGLNSISGGGEITYYNCNPEFLLSTDTGKNYMVLLTYNYIWKDMPAYEGIAKIVVFNKDNMSESVSAGRSYPKK